MEARRDRENVPLVKIDRQCAEGARMDDWAKVGVEVSGAEDDSSSRH